MKKKIFTITIMIVSFVLFIVSFFKEDIINIILSIPFIVLLVDFFHEFGHILACLITKTKIVSVKVLFFEIIGNKVYFLDRIYLGGSVKFPSNSKWRSLIYLMGPIFSFFLLICSILLYIVTLHKLFIMVIFVAFVSLILVLLPIKGTDVYNIKNYKRGSSYGKES